MILYIVRHGEPDYATDTLRPAGIEQAKKAALRLKEVGVDKIYSSTNGRAYQTAKETADLLGLPITAYDWARELAEDCKTLYPDGQSKILSKIDNCYWVSPEKRNASLEDSFETYEAFEGTAYREKYRITSEGIDGILSENGYDRTEEGFYKVKEPNEKHVVLFCHAGMGRILVSHLLNIPPQFLVSAAVPNFCSFTIFSFPKNAKIGDSVVPFLHAYGDFGHLMEEGKGGFLEINKCGERM